MRHCVPGLVFADVSKGRSAFFFSDKFSGKVTVIYILIFVFYVLVMAVNEGSVL